MSLERLKTRYTGEFAATYTQSKQQQASWRAEQETAERILTAIAGERGQGVKVLDVPVGTGRFFRAYRDLGMQARGYDISADMLREAGREAGQLGYSLELREADIMRLPLEDGAVDVVMCMRFLNHLEFDDLQHVLKELTRVTRSDLITTVGSRVGKTRAHLAGSRHARGALSGVLGRAVRRAGKALTNPLGAVRSLIRMSTAVKTRYTPEDVLPVFAHLGLTIRDQVTIVDERRSTEDEKRQYFVFHLRKQSEADGRDRRRFRKS